MENENGKKFSQQLKLGITGELSLEISHKIPSYFGFNILYSEFHLTCNEHCTIEQSLKDRNENIVLWVKLKTLPKCHLLISKIGLFMVEKSYELQRENVASDMRLTKIQIRLPICAV